MKEFIYGWIQDIAFYTILMEVVLHVLPEQGQKKYLQFFMGIVLIILVISPVLSAAGLDGQLDEAYARQTYDQELQEFQRRQQMIEESYESRLEERVEKAAEELEKLEQEPGGTGEEQPAEEQEEEKSVEIPEIAIPVSPQGDGSSAEEGSESSGIQTEEGSAGLSGGTAEETYEQRQERRLEEALRLVEGVGEVEVMITLEAGSELIVEKDQPAASQTVEETDSDGGSRTTTEESWSESTVYSEGEDGSRSPYVVKELEPRVQGVIVIAEGGGNAAVQQDILEAVQALFPVEAHKIKIMKMEGEK